MLCEDWETNSSVVGDLGRLIGHRRYASNGPWDEPPYWVGTHGCKRGSWTAVNYRASCPGKRNFSTRGGQVFA